MVEVLGFLIILFAVFVLRRLLGIERGRWITTLIAVVVGEAAAALIVRSIYGTFSGAPVGAAFGTWALVIVFAMLVVALFEMLSGPAGRRRRGGRRIPHPISGTRQMAGRGLRYLQVGRIAFRRHLLRTGGADGEVAGARLGRSLRAAMEDAGGLFVKLGQAMADQPQLVTPAVAAELAGLHDEAAPADPEAARAVIEEELGPTGEVFAEIASTPLGAASIAQTYLARLHDGREVVVKVQRPGVAESVLRDLDILRRLADRLDRRTTWARSIGLKELIAGFDERTREELDFRIEAANGIAARRALHESDPVRVPEVLDGFTTARVLVQERAEGRGIGAPGSFDRWDPERRRALADGLLSLTLRQMMGGELFHADPHPGNVFLRPDGRLALIDFGSVGRLDPYERAGLTDMLGGLHAEDPALLREGVLRIGTATHRIDEDAFDRELARLLSRSVGPDGTLSPDLFEQVLFVLRDFGVVLPRSTTTLFRTLATLLGTLRTICPGYEVVEAAQRVGGQAVAGEEAATTMSDLMMKTAMTNALILRKLPQQVDAIARSLVHGELRTRVSLLSEAEDVRVAKGMVNRLVMGLIASALSLSSAIMLSSGSAPALGGFRVVNVLGGVGLFFSVLLLLRVVVQILRDRE
jgi:ubiquinone biosynthesis protein